MVTLKYIYSYVDIQNVDTLELSKEKFSFLNFSVLSNSSLLETNAKESACI